MSELENIKAVLDYLNTVKDGENYKKNPPSLNDWLKLEKARLKEEYNNLCIINAEDKDIISQALIEMSNKYNVTNQFNVANKIDRVRKRFLDNETEKYVKTNYNKRIDTAAVLNYFYKITESEDPMDYHVINWITSEIERLKGEMKRLDILTATDEDIIQTALMEYGNKECYNNDVEIAKGYENQMKEYEDVLNNL